MKPYNWRIPVGLGLVVLGILAFMSSLNIIPLTSSSPWAITFAVIFAFVGATFLYALISDRRNWWAAIPGLTLIGLAALIGLDQVGFSGPFLPFIFMGSIAASFWVIYFLRRDYWWAIIPAGVLTSVALLILLSENGNLGASILFLGIAATFGVLGLIRVNGQKMAWPWIPAAVLAVLGGIIAASGGGVPAILWAVLIILAGVYLVARPYIQNKRQ